jgi:hypothetical protein
MFKKIFRFFKRLKLRFYLWSKKDKLIKTYEEDTTSYEKTSFLICLKMIKHSSTKFMIAPVSHKRYMENKELDLFITMNDGSVDLTNHIYHYHVKLSKRDWERVTYAFDVETEKRRTKYEEAVNSQIQNTLHNVLKRISNLSNNSVN